MGEIQPGVKLPPRIGWTGDGLYKQTKAGGPSLARRIRLFKD